MVTCTQCGENVAAGAEFCGECGAKVTSVAAAAAVPAATPAASTPAASTPAPAKAAAAPKASGGGPNDCGVCGNEALTKYVSLGEVRIHAECFVCCTCKETLAGVPYVKAPQDGKFYCQKDYYAAFNPSCGHCGETIQGQYINALGKSWCEHHFVCSVCSAPFPGDSFHKHNDRPYCREHYLQVSAEECSICNKPIDGDTFEALEQKYHLECFRCSVGDCKIGPDEEFHVVNNTIMCKVHFAKQFESKCSVCQKLINGEYVKVGEELMHPACWKCSSCSKNITPATFKQSSQNKFFCQDCFGKAGSGGGGSGSGSSGSASTSAGGASGGGSSGSSSSSSSGSGSGGGASGAGAGGEGKGAGGKGGFTVETFYTLDLLKDKGKCPASVVKSKKEEYLSESDFQKAFGCDKEAFKKMAKWRQTTMKKRVGIF